MSLVVAIACTLLVAIPAMLIARDFLVRYAERGIVSCAAAIVGTASGALALGWVCARHWPAYTLGAVFLGAGLGLTAGALMGLALVKGEDLRGTGAA